MSPWLYELISVANYDKEWQKMFDKYFFLFMVQNLQNKIEMLFALIGVQNSRNNSLVTSNTCTSDNILFLCVHINTKMFNLSKAENALKSALQVLLNDKLIQGKYIILDYFCSIHPPSWTGEIQMLWLKI